MPTTRSARSVDSLLRSYSSKRTRIAAIVSSLRGASPFAAAAFARPLRRHLTTMFDVAVKQWTAMSGVNLSHSSGSGLHTCTPSNGGFCFWIMTSEMNMHEDANICKKSGSHGGTGRKARGAFLTDVQGMYIR